MQGMSFCWCYDHKMKDILLRLFMADSDCQRTLLDVLQVKLTDSNFQIQCNTFMHVVEPVFLPFWFFVWWPSRRPYSICVEASIPHRSSSIKYGFHWRNLRRWLFKTMPTTRILLVDANVTYSSSSSNSIKSHDTANRNREFENWWRWHMTHFTRQPSPSVFTCWISCPCWTKNPLQSTMLLIVR